MGEAPFLESHNFEIFSSSKNQVESSLHSGAFPFVSRVMFYMLWHQCMILSG